MAHTVYFEDGSRELILNTDTKGLSADLERILRERFGKDMAELFLLYVESSQYDMEERLSDLQDDRDQYLDCLEDTFNELKIAYVMLCEETPDCEQISGIIDAIREKIKETIL